MTKLIKAKEINPTELDEEAAATESKHIASARAELKAAAKAKCMAAADAKRMASAAEAKLRESVARAQRNQNKHNERKSEDGSNKVHVPDHEAQKQKSRDVQESGTGSQAEKIAPAQKTQAVDEMENRGGAQTVNALPESEGISPAELAALDMCRFGATPQVAKMLVVAIQVGEINHIHFVEGI